MLLYQCLYVLSTYLDTHIDTYKHLFTRATYREMCVCVYKDKQICRTKVYFNKNNIITHV